MSLVNFLLPVDKDVLGLWSSSFVPRDRCKDTPGQAKGSRKQKT